MPRDIGGPENKSLREGKKSIGVLVYDVKKTDKKGGEWASRHKDGAPVEYIDSYNLPEHPPEGVTEVFMDSGTGPKFRSIEHQNNWSGVTFNQLVHGRDGSWVSLSGKPAKHASDFEIIGS